MKTSYNQLLGIQNQQLAEWAELLKPEIQKRLVKEVKARTWSALELDLHPATEVDTDHQPEVWDRLSSGIPRGTTIETILMNFKNANRNVNPK